MSDIPAPPDNPPPAPAPAPGGPKLSKQQKKDVLWLVAFVATCGMILLLTVILLMRVLRRRLREMEARRREDDMPDIWKAGGQRLTERMSKPDVRERVDPFDEPGGEATSDDPEDDPDQDRDQGRGKDKP
jgi:flagellar biosynthesis/type III secretory pathway M-ring protein FliF/YscJ